MHILNSYMMFELTEGKNVASYMVLTETSEKWFSCEFRSNLVI